MKLLGLLLFFCAAALHAAPPVLRAAPDRIALRDVPGAEYRTIRVRNGCMVNAIAFANCILSERMLKPRWCAVIGLQYADGGAHAVTAFEFDGQLWIYDPNAGSSPATSDLTLKSDALALARLARLHRRISFARFL